MRHRWRTEPIGAPYPDRCTQDVCGYCGLIRRGTTGGWLLSLPQLGAQLYFVRKLTPCPSYSADFQGKVSVTAEAARLRV